MKKKNLIILLLVPFIISLLGVVTINTTYNLIDNDILSIEWEYSDHESFKLSSDLVRLKAVGINQDSYPAGNGNSLVWTVKNRYDNNGEAICEIQKFGSDYFLKTNKCGEVIVTCSNEKGNVTRYMYVTIYDKGVVVVKPKIQGSGSNVSDTIYYGQYDLVNGEKANASFDIEVSCEPENLKNSLQVTSQSNNITVDLEKGKVNILGSGNAYFTVGVSDDDVNDATYSFNVVASGVNVYTYNDLLECTNYSSNGEVVVLRKNFESLENAYEVSGNEYIKKSSNTELFGSYNSKTKKFDFDAEVYRFTTTYNKSFIDQWNNFVSSKKATNYIDDKIICGLHVQKDFYGNGYTINMHNLTYPSSVIESTDANGNIVKVPHLSQSDLFRGPLPFYSLGDHNNMPLVEAYGQDNIGMYVDGDNIKINDVNLKNCDFGNMLANLNTTGTVMEINGDNVEVLNSRISNGKNVVRCFSSMNVVIKNSMLSNARNFLLSLGSNEYIEVNEDGNYTFKDEVGNTYASDVKTFFSKGEVGDQILNKYLMADFVDHAMMKDCLMMMQNAFNDKSQIDGIYKGKVEVTDVYFYRSGVSSIALETMFNGPFLYSKTPSTIAAILDMLQTQEGTSLGEFSAYNVGGLSYPVELTVKGKTRFYDYKELSHFDISGLINENISKFAASISPDFDGLITIDNIFPIKDYLISAASSKGQIYNSDGKTYINVPIAFYGGGLNLSKVNIENIESKSEYGENLVIDLMDNYLNIGSGSQDSLSGLKNMMLRSVTVVTGYEPFKFICVKNSGYLYGETPKVSDLMDNAKGE